MQVLHVIGQLSSWLTETQISSVLEYLSKFIFVNELSKNINCLVIAYGKVAAQSQHRALIFNRLIDDWKNSHSTQFRNRVLTIIGVMAKDICAEKSLDTIRVIHENANDQDNLTGLNDLNKNLSQIAQKHVDSAFQLFLTGLQDEKRENLRCADIEGLVQIHTLLSDGQRKVLLPLVIAQFNRPEKYSYKSVITLTYGLVKAFPEPERTQLLLDSLPILDSYVDLVLKYRGLDSMEIKGLQRLSKNEWLYKLSGRLTEKLSKWVALLENA